MKDIAIVIINYNTSEYTLKCVNAVFEKTNPAINFEIVVVDNNSNLDDYEHLKTNLPSKTNLSLYRSKINTGFGGGNMFGAQFCNAKYVLFLNNDAFLKNDCLSILYNYMENHTDVGVSTAQNYDEHDQHVISFDHDKGLRKLIFGRSFLEKNFSKRYPKRKKEYTQPITVNFVNGAFLFFRASVFGKVGGFDTNIFLYFEEMDICYRMRQLGYKAVLVPEAKINHHQGASTGKSKAITKEGLLSHFYVVRKNYSYLKYMMIRLYYSITFIIKPKKWFLLKTVLKGGHISESLKQKQTISNV